MAKAIIDEMAEPVELFCLQDPEKMNFLLDLAKCPVCFDELSSLAVFCVNGHPVCENCKTSQNDCPTCRCPFSQEKHTLVRQLLDALPRQCRFEDCQRIDFSIEDHEKWCGFRIEKCLECHGWSGPANLLLDHVVNTHGMEKIGPEYNYEDSNLNSSFSKVLLDVINSQLCWRLIRYNATMELLSFEFVFVPCKNFKKEDFFSITVEFESELYKHTSTLKVRCDSFLNNRTNKHKIWFDKNVIKNSMDDNGTWKYQLIIKEN